MNDVVFFQNYYTPYRHALFEEIVRQQLSVCVVYIHRPEDEGRQWRAPETQLFRSVQCQYIRLGKFILFLPPMSILFPGKSRVVILDNNPTNICMAVWALIYRMQGTWLAVWVEHINESYKSKGKMIYQRICSRILCGLSGQVISFSDMTSQYLSSIVNSKPIFRVNQAVPRPNTTLEWHRSDNAKVTVGYIGSYDARKNITLLISVFRKYVPRHMELHLAGFDRITEYEADNIVWHGYVSGTEKEKFFRSIDFLILPSLAEPWGLVVNEALYRGCLCAVSDQCGSRELVTQISPQLVFEPTENGLRAMLEYLCRIKADGDIERLTQRATAVASKYSIQCAAQSMIKSLTYGH
jgi:glycosyltransferase involved in cell wall biosynthesis